jgi:hypothetical protein
MPLGRMVAGPPCPVALGDRILGLGGAVDDERRATGKFLKAFEGHTHHVLDVGRRTSRCRPAPAPTTPSGWGLRQRRIAADDCGHDEQVTRLLFIGKTTQIITRSGDETVN